MSRQQVSHQRQPKTLGESAVCFACSVAILAVAAVALQWVMHFI